MRNASLLLLVDGETERWFLADQLTADGYTVDIAEHLRETAGALRERAPALAVIDTTPSAPDALQLIRALRTGLGAIDVALPLIALGPTGDLELQRALEHGADDYVGRPYTYVELRSRVAALLRRTSGHGQSVGALRVGEITIDQTARDVTVRGERVRLTGKEYELLRTLAAEPTRVFTKRELLRTVWGDTGVSGTRTLDTHACRLRQRLRSHGDQYVQTVWGVGYRLLDTTPVPA